MPIVDEPPTAAPSGGPCSEAEGQGRPCRSPTPERGPTLSDRGLTGDPCPTPVRPLSDPCQCAAQGSDRVTGSLSVCCTGVGQGSDGGVALCCTGVGQGRGLALGWGSSRGSPVPRLLQGRVRPAGSSRGWFVYRWHDVLS